MSDERLAGLKTDRGWDGEEANLLNAMEQQLPKDAGKRYWFKWRELADAIGLLVNELLDALQVERAELGQVKRERDEDRREFEHILNEWPEVAECVDGRLIQLRLQAAHEATKGGDRDG